MTTGDTPVPQAAPAAHAGSDSQIMAAIVRRHKRTLVGAVATVAVIAAAISYWLRPSLPPPVLSAYTPLTSDGAGKILYGTDGSRLYLLDDAVGAAQMSVNGGSLAGIPPPAGIEARLSIASISPDGSRLLARQTIGLSGAPGPLWAVPTLGGSPFRLANIEGIGGAWSPDGQKLAYIKGTSLYMANADGTASRKLVDLPGPLAGGPIDGTSPAWSPDGREIALNLLDSRNISHLWEVSADGKDLHEMFPGWHEQEGECCGIWMPDGKYFLFESQGQIWADRRVGSLLHKVNRAPIQLTAGPVFYSYPVPSRDGKTLFAVAGFRRGELERYNAKAGAFEPFLDGISAQDVSFSKDGEWVAYVTFPDGTLWKSRVDGSNKLQLSTPPTYAMLPRWSPDGNRIVFYDRRLGRPSRIYEVPAEGGAPQELMPDQNGNQADPSWSPEGDRLAFGGAGGDPSAIYILDMKTPKVTKLPNSDGLFSPRWSPDGQYLAALLTDSSGMKLFDFKARKWSTLVNGLAGYPSWSSDGRFVYFLRLFGDSRIERVAVHGGKIERVVNLRGFPQVGVYGFWLGLTPDDSPLLLKNAGAQEVVSMKWQAP
jgi:Tol biopolymer transport system component